MQFTAYVLIACALFVSPAAFAGAKPAPIFKDAGFRYLDGECVKVASRREGGKTYYSVVRDAQTGEMIRGYNEGAGECGDMSGQNLQGVGFSGGYYNKKNLRGANFEGAELGLAKMKYVDLTGANFYKADAQSVNFYSSILKGIKVNCETMADRVAFFRNANFNEADLSPEKYSNKEIQNVDFSNCDLLGATFRNADVSGVDFSNANLSQSDLRGMTMSRAPAIIDASTRLTLAGFDFTTALDFFETKDYRKAIEIGLTQHRMVMFMSENWPLASFRNPDGSPGRIPHDPAQVMADFVDPILAGTETRYGRPRNLEAAREKLRNETHLNLNKVD